MSDGNYANRLNHEASCLLRLICMEPAEAIAKLCLIMVIAMMICQMNNVCQPAFDLHLLVLDSLIALRGILRKSFAFTWIASVRNCLPLLERFLYIGTTMRDLIPTRLMTLDVLKKAFSTY